MAGKQRLLVVDDSQDMHELICALLEDEPVTITCVFGGRECLNTAPTLAPDLILLDVDMPDLNGFEVIKKLKGDPFTREVPVVFLTGYTSSQQKLVGMELGAVDYITKPFDPAELKARVRASLRTKQLMDELADKAEVLRESEERFRILAENSSDIITRRDKDGRWLYMSPAAKSIVGYDPQELIGRKMYELAHPDDVYEVAAYNYEAPKPGRTATTTSRFRHKAGHYVWLEATSRSVYDPVTGELMEVHATARDVTARKQAEMMEQDRTEILEMIAQDKPLRDVLHRLVSAVERQQQGAIAGIVLLSGGFLQHTAPNLPEEISQTIERKLFTFASRLCSESASATDPIGVTALHQDSAWADIEPLTTKHGLKSCWTTLIRSGKDDVMGMFMLYRHDEAKPDAQARALLPMAARLTAVAIEHRQLTDQLAHQSKHDALTGLPNRLLFEHRLDAAVAKSYRSGTMAAVLQLDVDRFKFINDTLGHQIGDTMLCELVARVRQRVKEADTLARMGGDEFALILTDISTPDDAVRVARNIIDAFTHPLEVSGQDLFITVSVGIAMYPTDGGDVMTLQKHADAAMYGAKSAGRNQYRVFTPEMNDGIKERLEMETALRRAIENNELQLFYQPKVDSGRKIVGLEALLRWRHPTLGQVSPAKFIPLAEDSGLIVPMGTWVLREAVRQCKTWAEQGIPRVPVAVNVSAMQFAQPDFLQTVKSIILSEPAAKEYIDIELTESLLMHNTGDVVEKLERLKSMGVNIAIDDFGTGYSSLSYLQRLPIDTLKIDRSFVSIIRPEHNPKADDGETAVIRAIAALARSLRMWTVAEGVETETQRQYLLGLGTAIMQGYLFSPAVPAPEVSKLLCRGVIAPHMKLAKSA